jgi:hypothetical protein
MMRAWVRMSVALVALTCLLGCVGPSGTIPLTKPTLAISRMLAYEKSCREDARALFRSIGETPSVDFMPWGIVWLEDEGVFAAGRYFESPEEAKEMGKPTLPELVEVRLTKAEAAEYFRLLLDGHTASAIAGDLKYSDADMGSVWFLCLVQVAQFPESAENRRVLGREFLKVLADAIEGSRLGKSNWMVSEAGRHLVEELGDLPLERWPEWYRKNGHRLYWDPITEKYKLQLELR